MYRTELQLDEKIDPIEDLILIDSDLTKGRQMLVPDNKAEVIIPFVPGIRIRPVGHSRDVLLGFRSGYFLMPRGRGLEIKCPNKNMHCLIIKVNPIYAKQMIDSLAEVSNGIYEMSLEKLHVEKLQNAYTNADSFLLKKLSLNLFNALIYQDESVSSTILDSIEQIKYSCGAISVKEIYSSLCVSKSKLEQHFNRDIGLTPKEFCKIEKINYFIRSYKKNIEKSLTELTYECGYYDQSHLIKDFRYFMDVSPKQYFETAIV